MVLDSPAFSCRWSFIYLLNDAPSLPPIWRFWILHTSIEGVHQMEIAFLWFRGSAQVDWSSATLKPGIFDWFGLKKILERLDQQAGQCWSRFSPLHGLWAILSFSVPRIFLSLPPTGHHHIYEFKPSTSSWLYGNAWVMLVAKSGRRRKTPYQGERVSCRHSRRNGRTYHSQLAAANLSWSIHYGQLAAG